MNEPRETSIPIIDAHVALGDEDRLHLAGDDLLGEMDRHSIATAVARPMGAELAVDNARGNDRVSSAGPRVKALITANPWYGDGAIEELRRCQSRGAVGLYLHPTRQGFMPTDTIVEPLLDFAANVRWPVVMHTGTYINSDVLALAELARRRPELTFVADSCGFADMWFELPGVLEELPNIVLCASMIWGRAIGNAVARFGPQRIMFGSGAPRDSIAAALKRIERLELGDNDQRAILHDNAARVFGLT